MKRSRLNATFGAILVGGVLLLPAVPAHASPLPPLANGIVSIEGKDIDYKRQDSIYGPVNGGLGRFFTARPEIKVQVTPDETKGRVEVRHRETGEVVCSSDSPVPNDATKRTFACTPHSDLPYGYDTRLVSVVVMPDGTEETEEDRLIVAARIADAPTAQLDSYDDATKTAHLSGTGTTGLTWYATNDRYDANDPLLPSQVHAQGDVNADGSWNGELVGVERNQRIYISLGIGDYATDGETIFLQSLEKLPAPQVNVESTPRGGYLFGTVTTRSPGTSEIFDADGSRVTYLGGNTTGPSTSHFALADSGRESHYTVVVTFRGQTSEPTPFVVNAGMGPGGGTPEFPDVSDVSVRADKVTAAVAGERNAVVRVLDANGHVLAVKLLGATGKAQVAFATPSARASSQITVTQTIGGATSPAAPVTIP